MVDLSFFEQLKVLTINDINEAFGLNSLHKVETLYLRKKIGKDLSKLANIQNVKELLVVESMIESLEGIQNLQSLQKLELSYNKNLLDISQINNTNIKELKILKCNNLTNLNILSSNKILNDIYCDNLDDLKFTETMALKSLGFKNLIDGNMSSVLRSSLKNIRFYPNKKHYEYKEVEINKKLQNNN